MRNLKTVAVSPRRSTLLRRLRGRRCREMQMGSAASVQGGLFPVVEHPTFTGRDSRNAWVYAAPLSSGGDPTPYQHRVADITIGDVTHRLRKEARPGRHVQRALNRL